MVVFKVGLAVAGFVVGLMVGLIVVGLVEEGFVVGLRVLGFGEPSVVKEKQVKATIKTSDRTVGESQRGKEARIPFRVRDLDTLFEK